jgi:hypothetical protein
MVGALMIFGGLAPAGAADAPDNGCTSVVGGLTITARNSDPGACILILNFTAYRYSSNTGEIAWDRVPGAVGYEIFRDGVSLGVQDVLSWYMTDLQPGRNYDFRIDAFDQDGNFMRHTASVTLRGWHVSSDCSSNSYC